MPKRPNARGSSMLISLVIIFVAAMAALWIAQTLLDHGRTNARRRESIRALYYAEGGVHEVIHWFNSPADFTFNSNLFRRDPDGTYTTLLNAIAAADGSLSIPGTQLPSFTNSDSQYLGRVVSIELMPSTLPKAICRVKSVGESAVLATVQRTVEMDLIPLDPLTGQAPAPLVSKGNIVTGGNVSVHWGEIWSRYTLKVPARSHMVYEYAPDGEKLVKFRTEASLDFFSSSGWKEGNSTDWYNPADNQPCLNLSNPNDRDEFGDRMFQNQSVQFPEYPYDTFKDFALHHGTYYFTKPGDDKIYKQDTNGNDVAINWEAEFDVPADRDGQWNVVFIDTIDRNPPNGSLSTPTTNLTTIKIAGSAPHTRGIFYINANVEITGIGNPPGLTVPDPTTISANTTLAKVMHQGLFIVNGKMINAGNMVVFGSVFVEGVYENTGSAIEKIGFAGTGTPTVWYDRQLTDGYPFPLLSAMSARMWRIY